MGTESRDPLDYANPASSPDPRGRWALLFAAGVVLLGVVPLLHLLGIITVMFQKYGGLAILLMPVSWIGALVSGGRGLFSVRNRRRSVLALLLTGVGSIEWIVLLYLLRYMFSGY